MTAHFNITVEPERGLLRMELGGFFEREDVQRFAVEKARAHTRLGTLPHAHVTLVDVRACRIQAQDVASVFAQVIRDPRFTARRVAFVTAGSLAKIQVRRLFEGMSTAQQFDDEVAARAWLFSD